MGYNIWCTSDSTKNKCEFNDEMRQLSETFNRRVMTTVAASPWSNGVCERLNRVIGNMVSQVIAHMKSNLGVALARAVSARNALVNNASIPLNN